MEPKKVIKKFTEFSDRNNPSIFIPNVNRRTRTVRRIMELPMGDRLGLFDVDAEKPTIQQRFIEEPWRVTEGLPPRMGQPIQVRFRDGINTDEIELQDFMRDWLHNQTGLSNIGYKKTICINTLDPTGVEIERWDLRGCFPSAVIYTTDNNDDVQTLEMTLHYDYCSINC